MSALSGHRLVPILDSGNYHNWKTKMEMLLIQEGLWGIVSTKQTAPAASGSMDRWQDDAKKATATIFLYVGERAERYIRDLRDPVEIWKRLKEVYELRGFSARFSLWQKLFTVQNADHRQEMKATESYIDSCWSICEQLRGSGATVSNEIEASVLLNGLDNAFETFVVTTTQSFQSNGKTDEVNVEDLISQIPDEDRRHTAKNGQKAASGVYGLIARKKQPRLECKHCHRTGHTKEMCWSLHPELRPNKAVSKAAASYAM